MITKKGKVPCNARIDIDYTKKKPKIKFTYPKKNPVSQNIVGIHTYILLFIWFIFFMAIEFIILERDTKLNPSAINCNPTINETNFYAKYESSYDNSYNNFTINNSYLKGINIKCRDSEYNLSFDNYNKLIDKAHGINHTDLYLQSSQFFFFILMGIINYLLTKWIVKQKWYQDFNPKFQAWSLSKVKMYMKFLPKDVEYNVCIIPKFKNVEMNYNAEGEFSKYLERVSVREQQYYKVKKGVVSKKLKKDIFTWSAIFYFKQKPKTGFLEVTYQ